MPLAEQTGLIDPLTDWVIARALSQIGEWGAAAERLSVSVNVSARNLSHPMFADRVLAALETSGLPYDRLLLEITETALFTDVDRATAVLERLSRAGVPISLDDFGQGKTSLGFLSKLPLQELKIDRAFVTDMLVDTSHGAIVRSIIELAHNLGFVVVAEGVEGQETMRALFDMGCDAAQGYVLRQAHARLAAARLDDGVRPGAGPRAARLADSLEPACFPSAGRCPRWSPRSTGPAQPGRPGPSSTPGTRRRPQAPEPRASSPVFASSNPCSRTRP